MANRIELSDIAITHISLVKAGANGKEFIYKSTAVSAGYENIISIKKTDEEQGVVYGIVYAPEEVDSQGDFASAVEIKKAAYAFMKSLNAKNVDVEHSFNNENAFVAESWIVKTGDSIFPNEPDGSWAVAIQLESEALKKSAREGELQGLSMAGQATKTEVEKAESIGDSAFKNFFTTMADITTGVWVEFSTYVEKSKNKGDTNMAEVMKSYAEIMKEKLVKATKEAGDALSTQNAKVEKLEASAQKTADTVKALEGSVAQLQAVNKELVGKNETLEKTTATQAEQIDALQTQTTAVVEAVKVTKQKSTINKPDIQNDKKGTL